MRLNPNELTPVLPPQSGVCGVCRGWSGEFARCYQCAQAAIHVGEGNVPVVLPLALAVHDGPLAHALWRYKNADGDAQRDAAGLLASLLREYASRHLGCLARAAGVDHFDVTTWMPSARRQGVAHPLRLLLKGDAVFGDALTDLVEVDPTSTNDHALGDPKHSVRGRLDGAAVLIVDDTWTSGSSIFDSVLALREAGASSVSALVLGRAFRPEYRGGWRYSQHASALGFDPDFCALCDGRSTAVTGLLGGGDSP